MIKSIKPIASVNIFQTSHIFQLGQFLDVLDKQIAHNSVTSHSATTSMLSELRFVDTIITSHGMFCDMKGKLFTA